MLANTCLADNLSTLSTFNWGKLQLLNVDFCLHNPYTRFLHFCRLCRLLRQTFRFHNPVSTGFVFFIHIIHISAGRLSVPDVFPEKDTSHSKFSCAIIASGNVGGCRTFRLLRLRKRSRFQWPILSYTVTVQSLQPVFPTRLSMNICLMPTGNSSRFTSTCCAL